MRNPATKKKKDFALGNKISLYSDEMVNNCIENVLLKPIGQETELIHPNTPLLYISIALNSGTRNHWNIELNYSDIKYVFN